MIKRSDFDLPEQLHRQNTMLPESYLFLEKERLDPEVWGPHYWFFIQTLAHTYPETPTAVTKRKYYDFLQNLPIFIPNHKIGDDFAVLLDKYPVAPYLDNRESFLRWVHFIHNKINVLLHKDEITLYTALDEYRRLFRSKNVAFFERFHIRKEYVFFAGTLLLLVAIFVLMRF
jgi:hypothetical protein